MNKHLLSKFESLKLKFIAIYKSNNKELWSLFPCVNEEASGLEKAKLIPVMLVSLLCVLLYSNSINISYKLLILSI